MEFHILGIGVPTSLSKRKIRIRQLTLRDMVLPSCVGTFRLLGRQCFRIPFLGLGLSVGTSGALLVCCKNLPGGAGRTLYGLLLIRAVH